MSERIAWVCVHVCLYVPWVCFIVDVSCDCVYVMCVVDVCFMYSWVRYVVGVNVYVWGGGESIQSPYYACILYPWWI